MSRLYALFCIISFSIASLYSNEKIPYTITASFVSLRTLPLSANDKALGRYAKYAVDTNNNVTILIPSHSQESHRFMKDNDPTTMLLKKSVECSNEKATITLYLESLDGAYQWPVFPADKESGMRLASKLDPSADD